MVVPTKVISSNVLANRNVNVPDNSLVTKSPLTFSKKLERPQKSKINSFFPVSSKGKSDSISPTGQTSPAGSAFKVMTAPTKSDNQTSGNGGIPTSLDASLGFPMDDWDDLDDFETPVKAKNDSFSSEMSGKSANPPSSLSEEKSLANKNVFSRSEQTHMETDQMEQSLDQTAASPGPGSPETEYEAPPIRVTRRPPQAHRKSVVSDNEEDNQEVLEPFKGMSGKKLCDAAFGFNLNIVGMLWVWKA